MDSHLEGVIDQSEYSAKKEELIKQKIDLEGKTAEIMNKGNNWLEPMREFILSSSQAKKIALEGDLQKIRTFIKKIGSNFTVKGKKFEFLAKIGWRVVAQISPFAELQGRQESNPHLLFWREMYYHYTTPL